MVLGKEEQEDAERFRGISDSGSFHYGMDRAIYNIIVKEKVDE